MTASRIILVHPTANQNVRETATALAESGLLDQFWTCVHWRRDGLADRIAALMPRVRDELRRRSFGSSLEPFIRTFGWREWGRQLSGVVGSSWLTRGETGLFSMDAVYHSLGRHVAGIVSRRGNVRAIYAYDAGALEVFRAAKKVGLKCIYEHPIVYWRKVQQLQQEEAALKPEWASTLLTLRDSPQKLARKDEELALADVVVVASTFARNSLSSAPHPPPAVCVIPYGAPPPRDKSGAANPSDRLRVLFVGALTQAKGLSYLFDAVARLANHVELTLVGQRVSPRAPTQAELDRHRWIPSLPHDRLLEEMSRADVLVLPSLHEGFGLVILEAMAQGVPVITTQHTGGADVIEDGVDGFLVPIRSADAIFEKLEDLVRSPHDLGTMKDMARRKAGMRSWSKYRGDVIALAREVIAN